VLINEVMLAVIRSRVGVVLVGTFDRRSGTGRGDRAVAEREGVSRNSSRYNTAGSGCVGL
jgi:hypothetical protein